MEIKHKKLTNEHISKDGAQLLKQTLACPNS